MQARGRCLGATGHRVLAARLLWQSWLWSPAREMCSWVSAGEQGEGVKEYVEELCIGDDLGTERGIRAGWSVECGEVQSRQCYVICPMHAAFPRKGPDPFFKAHKQPHVCPLPLDEPMQSPCPSRCITLYHVVCEPQRYLDRSSMNPYILALMQQDPVPDCAPCPVAP